MSIRNSGATVTPSIVTDSSGQEIVSYEMGEVRSGSQRMEQIEEFNETDDGYFFDETGQLQHSYADLDPERVQQITEDDYFGNSPTGEDVLEGTELPQADINELMNIAGGEAEYSQMMSWASENLPDEGIARFDEIIASSDYQEIQEYISTLHNLYRNSMAIDSTIDENQDEELSEKELRQQQALEQNTREIDASNNFVVQQYGGPEQYQRAMNFARENVPASVIEEYNFRMSNSTNPQERVALAQQMAEGLAILKQQQR